MARALPHLLLGLDLNASRASAAEGGPGLTSRLVPLEGDAADLPLAVSLEGKTPTIGRTGLALCRRAPHLACVGFLPLVGGDRVWRAGRHALDAAKALTLVLERVADFAPGATAAALVVPAYLPPDRVEQVVLLAEKAKLPVRAWLTTPLAAAVAGAAEGRWNGTALVVDVDEHALTWAAVAADDREIHVLDAQPLPQLGLRAWRDRLLGGVADRCVRQCRRDPRDSADAEQSLFDQFDGLLDACRHGQLADVMVQMTGWGQNLILRPDEVEASVAGLVREALAAMRGLCAALPPGETPPLIFATDAAARLPGLTAALEAVLGPPVEEPTPAASTEDFGAALLDHENDGRRGVVVLAPDAVARAACDLAARVLRGSTVAGRLHVAPLPTATSAADVGPPRVQFRNQEFVLRGASFVLGRHADCDLVFDSTSYPTVSGRHCEIVCERRVFLLRDRSRNGTLVNERPVAHETVLQSGDWIRLGPGGPSVRFLGQAADGLRLVTA